MVICKHRQDCIMKLIEILRLMYKEMKANEYDCEANQTMGKSDYKMGYYAQTCLMD